jgi:hypothetical protein
LSKAVVRTHGRPSRIPLESSVRYLLAWPPVIE